MGFRVIQKIHECAKCGTIPEDGDTMWYMGYEVWCDKCANYEDDNETK